MKQLKHLRQTLWRALLCLTVVVGFAAPGWAKTVYWDNSEANWSSVYAYLYVNDNDKKTVGPLEVTTVDGKSLYSVDAENYPNIIFKNSEGWDQQTEDLAATDGYVYSNANLKDTKKTSPVGKVVDGVIIYPLGSSNLYIGVGSSAESNSGSRTSLVEDSFFTGYTFEVTNSQKFMFYNASASGSWFGANGSVQTVTADGTEYTAKGYTPTKAYQINGTGQYKLIVTSYDGSEVKFNITKIGGGDVTTTEYDYYFKRSRDWNNPEKLEFTDGKATLTRDMNASGQFGISVCTKGTKNQITNGWYAKGNSEVVEAGTHTYPLVNSGTQNFRLPDKGGNYTFVITLDENDLPKDITITTPEIAEVLPDIYIGGSWMSGQDSELKAKTEMIAYRSEKYNEYVVKTSKDNEKFRFYSKSATDGLGNWMGSDGSDYTFSDTDLEGSNVISTVGSDKTYVLPKAGIYKIRVSGYDKDKTVKFTISYTAPEKHLYLGATFKGNIEDPNFQLDNGKRFNKVRFTKYGNDGTVEFRFANEFNRNNWIGPSSNQTVTLDKTNATGTYTTSASSSLQVYKVATNGVYELEVLSWNDFEVKFKLNFIEEVEEGTPFYFVGDMNDWYSLEFEDPNAEKSVNMGKFMNERDAWRFRKVKANDANLPDGVDIDWYVFDGFPDKQLSGQFQITSGGTNIWNGAEVYGHGTALNSGNLFEQGHGSIKAYHKNRVTDEMITDGIKFSAKGFGIQKRSSKEGSFPNFHMECNAVADAKIYFKPGDNPDMIITGRPRHFFVFYANTKNELGDDTIFAKINEGKPNTNNYFLPGIKFDGQRIPFYTKNTCGNTTDHHMYSDEGIELNKVEKFKLNEHGSEAEIRECFKKLGVDDVIADEVINNGKLPNGRLVDSFEHLYVARIPAGFENPAGWKYTLSLPKALSSDDREKPVAIACNHIYFMPTINGVSVHVNDDNFMSDKYYVELEDGVKTPMSEFDVQYYYRVYYSKPAEDGNSYEIKVVDHRPGNVIYDEYIAYRSGIDTRKPTLQETGRKREFGWKPLNAHTSPEAVNATITEEQWAAGEKGWDIKEGNLSGIQDEESKWHICWVESTDRLRRQRIPKELSNAYIQILACYFKKDNANNPMRMKTTRAAAASEIETVEAPEMAVALENADHVSIEPGELSFDNDVFHHPLQGNHLYYVLDNNAAVWTGIESIEDDFIGNTVEGDVNATPVYYNLQGVRVAEPTKGIFIEVRGNKSRKVAY